MSELSDLVAEYSEAYARGDCPRCGSNNRVIESHRPNHKKCNSCSIEWRDTDWALRKMEYLEKMEYAARVDNGYQGTFEEFQKDNK